MRICKVSWGIAFETMKIATFSKTRGLAQLYLETLL